MNSPKNSPSRVITFVNAAHFIVERAAFPERIEPAQPFFDIRAISHQVAPGVTATCRMEGDAFEMEDQRNWSDASYKTYVRPLALPWPYTLPAGESVRQTITLTLAGTPATPFGYSVANQARDLQELLDHFGMEQVVILERPEAQQDRCEA
jgi:hypothetical protein